MVRGGSVYLGWGESSTDCSGFAVGKGGGPPVSRCVVCGWVCLSRSNPSRTLYGTMGSGLVGQHEVKAI